MNPVSITKNQRADFRSKARRVGSRPTFVRALLASGLLCLGLQVRAADPVRPPGNLGVVSLEPAPLNPTITLGRDGNGRVALVIRADGSRTEYEYDSQGRTRLERFADGTTREFEYDEKNRISLEKRGELRTRLLYAPAETDDGDDLVAKVVSRSPDEEQSLRQELRKLTLSRTGRAPAFSADPVSGRMSVAENAFGRVLYSYGPNGGDYGVTLETKSFRLAASQRALSPNAISVSDDQGGNFLLGYHGPGPSEVARVESDGTLIFVRSFDALGRVSGEVFAQRFEVVYEYVGGSLEWTRKTIRNAHSRSALASLDRSPAASFFIGTQRDPSPEALRRLGGVAPVSHGEVQSPENHPLAWVTAEGVTWFLELFDSPYAEVENNGRVSARRFGTSARTPWSGDEIILTAASAILVVESAGAGSAIIEVPRAESSTSSKQHRNPHGVQPMMVWACGDPHEICDVEGYNCAWYTPCGWSDGGGGGGGGDPAGGGGAGSSLPTTPLSIPDKAKVNAAKNAAKAKLTSLTCAGLFTPFGQVGVTIINGTRYVDGTNVPDPNNPAVVPCANGSVPAWTLLRARIVEICPFNFTSSSWVTIIHEAMHEAGQPENPPSPAEINAMVTAACNPPPPPNP